MENRLAVTLSNEKVLLRPLEANDEQALQVIASEEDLWAFGLKDLGKSGELKKYIQAAIKARQEGICAVWVIIDLASGRIAGCTRLGEISWHDERGQIGWTWIGKDFQGSGLNRAMKYEMLDFGFNVLKLNRIEFKADELNVRSRKAILGIGATEEGILRQHMRTVHGNLRNTVFYSILRSEWLDIKETYFKQYSK